MFYSKLIFKKQEEDIFLLNPRYKNPGNKDKRYSQCQQDDSVFEIHKTTKEWYVRHPVSFRHYLFGEVTILD